MPQVRRNAWYRLAAVAAVMCLGALPAGWAQQERQQPKDSFSGVERIVAVGDVHGDYDQLVKALRAAGVINDKGEWIAGKTHLVQTGDVLDRGADSRKALDLLMSLEEQAAKAGGAVHCLIGNHEAMVVAGDYRYLVEGEVKSYGGLDELAKLFGPEGKYGKWIRGHNAVVKVNGLVFVHGGISPEVAEKSITEVNKAVRESLGQAPGHGLASDSNGPLWLRDIATGPAEEVAPMVEKVLKAWSAEGMVIGHTPTNAICPAAGGKVIRIDVGMTAVFGGPASCLVVEKGVFYDATAGKEKRKLDGVTIKLPTSAPASQPATARQAA